MGEHTQQHAPPVAGAIDRVARALAVGDALSPQSLRRMVELFERFGGFVAAGHGGSFLGEVTAACVEAFVEAPGSDGAEPTIATRHLRRAAIRLLFRTARELDLATGDPTLDLVLPPRSRSTARPLADEEVALCRSAALYALSSTRLAAAWALAEATARTAELPHLRLADLDLDRQRVWVHGSPRTEARWGALSGWGVAQLARRVRELGRADPSTVLVYRGDGSAESGQASSCQAVGETLRRAGLAAEPDVRPVSVAAWAGARVLAETGRIEVAARVLGCRSLEGAARLVGFDWRTVGDTS